MTLKVAVGALLTTLFCSHASGGLDSHLLDSQPVKDGCFVYGFNPRQGMTGEWHMFVVNDGVPCEIRRNIAGTPATTITIHVKPENGALSVEAPAIRYTPKANFTGNDVFEVEWVGLEWAPYFPLFFNKTTRATILVTVRAKGAESTSPPRQ
jgi:hypothetical protein